MAFQVKLDVFEGPFDLLLSLISKHEIDIYQVNITDITNEYLLYLENMRTLDLDIATEFLLMAATLLKLKSESLLPAPTLDAEEDIQVDSLEELVWRLLEYRKFRGAAEELERRLGEEERCFYREVEVEAPLQGNIPDILGKLSLSELARAASGLRAKEPEVDLSHIAPLRVNMREYIYRVIDSLEGSSEVSFTEITRECIEKLEVIVFFLALLELYKWNMVTLRQAVRFGDIRVVMNEGVDRGAIEELLRDL